MDDARLRAAASDVLRLLAGARAELQRTKDACDAEITRIQERYARVATPIAQRVTYLEHQAQEIARRIEYPKGKKSVAVGNGMLGKKQRPAQLVIVDEAALLVWAREHRPDLVRCTLQLSQREVDEYLVAAEQAAKVKKREVLVSTIPLEGLTWTAEIEGQEPHEVCDLPPGVEQRAAVDEYYAKPEVAS